MKTNVGVYKIVNLVNGKIYIGSSINLKNRKYNHFRYLARNTHCNNYLQNSYNKYGKDNFIWEVIEYIEFNDDKEILKKNILDREQYWIDTLKVCDDRVGYNINPIALNRMGTTLSEETRRKISNSCKNPSKEKRDKLSNASKGKVPWIKGKKHSEETKNKIKERAKNRIVSEETKRKIGDGNRGKIISKETRRKLSILKKGNNHFLGKRHSEETKYKMRKAREKLDPLIRKKVMNIETGVVFSSVKEAALFYNIKSPSHISRVCLGLERSANGYTWKYVEEDIL